MLSINRVALTLFVALAFSACSKHSSSNPGPQSTTSTLNVTGFSPNNGPDSTQVTISGTGFSATVADDLVSFNGKQATVLNAASTSLVVQTPTLAGTGNITVTVSGKTITAGLFTYDTSWRGTTINDTISTPEYLSIDDSGNVYVSSNLNCAIYKITPAGSISQFASILYPTGTAFDASGNLYVVSNSEYIYKVSPTGTATLFATDPPPPASLFGGVLLGLALDPAGNVYVSNQANKSVDMISPQGVVSVYDSNITLCSGLAANGGKLYVAADNTSDTGSAFGTVLAITGTESATPAASNFDYNGNSQVTFDKNNNLYVTSLNYQNLQGGDVLRVSPDGTQTYIEMPDVPYITGIVSDDSGHLYVTGSQSSPGDFAGSLIKLTMH